MTATIHRAGPEATDWRLVVTEAGDVEARKRVPYDGVLYYSTEDRPNSIRKRSEFGLSVRTVVHRYVDRVASDVTVDQLVAECEAKAGLAEVQP